MSKILNKENGTYLVNWSPENKPFWGNKIDAINASEEQIEYFKKNIDESVLYLIEVDEPKVDEPKVDEPKVDEPKVDEPKNKILVKPKNK